jgi:pimeloyl-ACP methyl ester carboxylesterase
MNVSVPALRPLPPIWRESRVPLEYTRLMLDPVWKGKGIPHGDGRQTLLVCGFLAGDPSMTTMARWLKRIGHRPVRAQLRWNVDCSGATIDRLEERAERMADESGRRIAVVGQSRGGTFARGLATRRPDLVEKVTTLGSPLRNQFDIHPGVLAHIGVLGTLGTLGVPGLFSRSCTWGDCCTQAKDEMLAPLPPGVSLTSIYSRSDGIVRWRSCLDEDAEHVEVPASHIGMAVSAPVYREVARALA